MAIDITKRHLDQAELIASEARYRVLADLNPQAIWMGDAEGRITYANQGFLCYLGLRRETLPKSGWLNALAPRDRESAASAWMHSVTTGQDFDLEAQLLDRRSGAYRWWRLRAAPVRDDSGAILHWLGVGHDTHDQKTSAEMLRQKQLETERQHAELETIYQTSPVGLALIDPVEFRFLNLNDREAEMLGLPRPALVGRPLTEISAIPELVDLFRSVAQGQRVVNRLIEGELATKPGERRAWSVNYSPLFDEHGNVRAISTASIEITDQRRAEAALVQSEKLAAVGRLASSISHEINNPLEAITNLLYIISFDATLPENLKGYVQTAQAELSRVSQIVTQTLRFHRQAVAPTLVAAGELLDAVILLYTGRLANSNVVLETRYRSNTRVLCFENDIRQVLNNLIANAIDAMRTGGRLILRTHDAHDPTAGADPVRGVRLTVADTGHGMGPEIIGRIFEPFFTTKDLNGTGLGLWISAGIVERHKGHLRVRSSNRPGGHYSVFTLFLPADGAALTAPKAVPAAG
jgi:PAS domain S-box-containing protein